MAKSKAETQSKNALVKLVSSLLPGKHNTIPLSLPVAQALGGDLEAAIIFSQCMYWSERTDDPDGYFYKCYDEWYEETTIKERTCRDRIKKLEAKGWIHTLVMHVYGVPKLHIRVLPENFVEDLIESHDEIAKVAEEVLFIFLPLVKAYGLKLGSFISLLASSCWVRERDLFYWDSLYSRRYALASPDLIRVSQFAGISSEKTIRNLIKSSVESGVLVNKNINDAEAAEILKTKNPSNSSVSFGILCDWCGSDTACLHDHHYPIRRSHGGTETVSICPNCHMEFHQLTERTYYGFTDGFIAELSDLGLGGIA